MHYGSAGHILRRRLQNPANSGGAASSLLTIRCHTGNEDVAPPWFCKCPYGLVRYDFIKLFYFMQKKRKSKL